MATNAPELKCYLGTITERNGEREYVHSVCFKTTDPAKYIDQVAATFLKYEGGVKDGDGYYFSGGMYFVQPGSYREADPALYASLDKDHRGVVMQLATSDPRLVQGTDPVTGTVADLRAKNEALSTMLRDCLLRDDIADDELGDAIRKVLKDESHSGTTLVPPIAHTPNDTPGSFQLYSPNLPLHLFDAVEIHPIDEIGEQCEEADATYWAIFLHYNANLHENIHMRGVTCVADMQSKASAHAFADGLENALAEVIGRDVLISMRKVAPPALRSTDVLVEDKLIDKETGEELVVTSIQHGKFYYSGSETMGEVDGNHLFDFFSVPRLEAVANGSLMTVAESANKQPSASSDGPVL